MPQYFHRRWNTVAKVSLFGFPFFLVALGVAGGLVARSPYMTGVNLPVEQPVAFSHAVQTGHLGPVTDTLFGNS